MFLFILMRFLLLKKKIDSNTSHVFIYLYKQGRISTWRFIQIHLMFLFIMGSAAGIMLPIAFKYISCFYLSLKGWLIL